ncbi:MAG TPA: outer membrane protein assembly factor BamD, partial [Thermoanaerobaculia bacterium]|nr:outer membrane protein assembly factor BamD [Thermoanaerobaculia bacterium]
RLTDLLAALFASVAECQSSGGAGKKPDKITQELLTQPKEALFEKGKALIAKKKYDQGRKYLNYVFETYPNETVGREALLLVADSYFQQKSAASYTEARYRYRDYLNRYPGAPNRDYARYQFAYCYDKEHESPDRDQTATREAIEQYRALIREFPDSGYSGAARERIRRLTDLLAEHDFGVGYFYCGRARRPPPCPVSSRSSSGFRTTSAATNSSSIRPRPCPGWVGPARPRPTTTGFWRSSPRAISPSGHAGKSERKPVKSRPRPRSWLTPSRKASKF